jgi:hypothetical protein
MRQAGKSSEDDGSFVDREKRTEGVNLSKKRLMLILIKLTANKHKGWVMKLSFSPWVTFAGGLMYATC